MSSSSNVTPSASDSRVAYALVVEPVANPGIVKASTSLRGRPRRSIALHATISAWVESRPPLTPITALGVPIACEALLEPGDLDVVGLVAVELEPGRVVGHEREAVDLAPQPDVARGRRERELDLAEVVGGVVRTPVVVEAALPQPLLAQPVEVDVHDRAPRPVGEPLALAEQVAALVDHRLAVPLRSVVDSPCPAAA